jgi:hypothetical protein
MQPTFHPLEALAGWLVPGLGHIILGQVARGLAIMLAVIGLWLGGMLIGGIGVIDSLSPPEGPGDQPKVSLWFIGQAMVAPSLAINLFVENVNAVNRRENRFYPSPQDYPAYQPSLGHSNELGTLSVALAGMLNLLAILDVVWCDAAARRRPVVRVPLVSAPPAPPVPPIPPPPPSAAATGDSKGGRP